MDDRPRPFRPELHINRTAQGAGERSDDRETPSRRRVGVRGPVVGDTAFDGCARRPDLQMNRAPLILKSVTRRICNQFEYDHPQEPAAFGAHPGRVDGQRQLDAPVRQF